MRTLLLTFAALLIAVPAFAQDGGDPAAARRMACENDCKTKRLVCSQKDPRGQKCGTAQQACFHGCAPAEAPKFTKAPSCTQKCEDAAQQCGVRNLNIKACHDGRNACLERCGN